MSKIASSTVEKKTSKQGICYCKEAFIITETNNSRKVSNRLHQQQQENSGS
jgi:hypothetical protein